MGLWVVVAVLVASPAICGGRGVAVDVEVPFRCRSSAVPGGGMVQKMAGGSATWGASDEEAALLLFGMQSQGFARCLLFL